jgi:hypothetical protein
VTCGFGGASVGSCGDLILAGEPVEDRSAADLMVGEVDHLWRLGFGLGRCELRKRSVWPRGSDMVEVDVEDLPSVAFVDDQYPLEQFAAQRSDHPFADRIRPRRSRWTGKDPDAVRDERPGEPRVTVSEQERDRGGALAEVHQQGAGGLSSPRTGRMRAHPDQICPAGAMRDGDQGVDPGEEHGVHVYEGDCCIK